MPRALENLLLQRDPTRFVTGFSFHDGCEVKGIASGFIKFRLAKFHRLARGYSFVS